MAALTSNAVTIKCEQCEKEFKVHSYRAKIARFCTHKCYSKTVHKQIKTDKWYKVMKKHIPWNKGKKWDKATREKLSKAQKARFQKEDIWNKGMKFPERSGEKNHNWKGGTQSKDRIERIKFRKTIQKKVLERDNYTCQFCGERGKKLQVDHIQPWSEYIDLRFDINNCRTVCMECHYQITFGKPMPKKIKNWGHNLSHIKI